MPEKKSYLIADTTKEERIALIKQWIPDDDYFIEKIGFLPLFKNEIPGFSLEERTVPEFWWSDDAAHDPWIWRELIARSGRVA